MGRSDSEPISRSGGLQSAEPGLSQKPEIKIMETKKDFAAGNLAAITPNLTRRLNDVPRLRQRPLRKKVGAVHPNRLGD